MVLKNIIASGGGIKALGLIGALNALNDTCVLDTINVYIGCSASSIVLLFTILGYNSKEVFELSKKCSENALDNENSILNLIQDGGLGRGMEYTEFVDSVIEKKTNKKYCTFSQLYKITNKTLTLCITNLNSGKAIYMNHKNYPNFIISEAIRVSCGLPLLFTPSVYYKVCIQNTIINTNKKEKKEEPIESIEPIEPIEPIETIEKKTKKYYYLCCDNENYIGICNKTSNIKISKNKDCFKQILYSIKYITSQSKNDNIIKSWVITSFNETISKTNNKFNNNQLNNKSTIIEHNSELIINDNITIYFQDILAFADGAILDVFPIHLSKNLTDDTIGITYEYEKGDKKSDRNCNETIIYNNLLNYMTRIKEITIDNSYWTKINKYKSNYVIVDIPRHIGMCHFNISENDIRQLITNGYNSTMKYLIEKNISNSNDTTTYENG
jgi:hypothetical protein